MSFRQKTVLQNLPQLLSILDEAIEAKCPASLESGHMTLENGVSLDLQGIKGLVLELAQANVEMIEEFTSGQCYETKNPYRRQCVAKALTVLGSVVRRRDIVHCLPEVKEYLQLAGSKRRESFLVAVIDANRGVLMQLYAKTQEEAVRVAVATGEEFAGLENAVGQVIDKEAVPGLWLEGKADYIRSVIA